MQNNIQAFRSKGWIDNRMEGIIPIGLLLMFATIICAPYLMFSGYLVLGVLLVIVGIGGPVGLVVGLLTHVTESLSPNTKHVYLTMQRIKKEHPGLALPEVPMDVLLNMDDVASDKLSEQLAALEVAYLKNQEAIKVEDFRIKELAETLDDKIYYLNQHTKELNSGLDGFVK